LSATAKAVSYKDIVLRAMVCGLHSHLYFERTNLCEKPKSYVLSAPPAPTKQY